jgi:hypothetical protein
MRHHAQAHRTGESRAALERVQRSHAARSAGIVARPVLPFAHARSELWQQLVALFLEYREQLGVDGIDGIDIVGATGHGSIDLRGGTRWLSGWEIGQGLQRHGTAATLPNQRVRRRRRRDALPAPAPPAPRMVATASARVRLSRRSPRADASRPARECRRFKQLA